MPAAAVLKHRSGPSAGSSTNMQKLRSLVQAPKPQITIHYSNRRSIYSTADTIEGTVRITAPVDTPFESVDIEFLGNSRTVVDSVTTTPAISGRTEAFNPFLKVEMPGLQAFYPEGRVFIAGKTYDFPFTFIVPEHLPIGACSQQVKHPSVRDAHLMLPPTFGDKDVSDKDPVLDDMAPQMASVRYGVFVRVTKLDRKRGEEPSRSVVGVKAQRVRVIPGTDDAPPLDVSGPRDNNSMYKRDYELRKERKIKKGVMGNALGTLIIESEQPTEFRTPPPDQNSKERVTTMATVMLRFEPVKSSSAPPPRLEKLTAKLKVRNYYSTVSRSDIPKPSDENGEAYKAVHSESLELSSRAINKVDWTLEDPTHPSQPIPLSIRRASAASTSSNPGPLDLRTWIPKPSETYKEGAPFYLAHLVVPLELPANKFFVPTFHSCFVSRIYTIGLSLSFSPAGLHGSMDLRIPVQICASRSSALEPAAAARRRSSAASTNVQTDVDEDIAALFEARSQHARPGADYRSANPAWSVPRSLPSSAARYDQPPIYEDHMMDRRFDMSHNIAAMHVGPVR